MFVESEPRLSLNGQPQCWAWKWRVGGDLRDRWTFKGQNQHWYIFAHLFQDSQVPPLVHFCFPLNPPGVCSLDPRQTVCADCLGCSRQAPSLARRGCPLHHEGGCLGQFWAADALDRPSACVPGLQAVSLSSDRLTFFLYLFILQNVTSKQKLKE